MCQNIPEHSISSSAEGIPVLLNLCLPLASALHPSLCNTYKSPPVRRHRHVQNFVTHPANSFNTSPSLSVPRICKLVLTNWSTYVVQNINTGSSAYMTLIISHMML